MNFVDRILLQNKAWAQEQLANDPKYFSQLSSGQTPRVLWIGCSDSRVPADVITATGPGEIFVHRNVANLARPDDMNVMSALEYSVAVLEVSSVIVCGHRYCGGVKAAMSGQTSGVIDTWLQPIKKIHAASAAELEGLNEEAREVLILEKVVRAQVESLAETPVVKKAWAERRAPTLHGMVFGMKEGHLRETFRLGPDGAL